MRPLPVLCSVLLALITAVGAPALAQEPAEVDSLGEVSRHQLAFYECKPGPAVGGVATWREVTTLMLAAPTRESTAFVAVGVTVIFFDGNANPIAQVINSVKHGDLDEINVCRTLHAAGISVPQAGLIQMFSSLTGLRGYYCWVKNVLGKFFVTENEPFKGRVDGIAKTQCRVVPPSQVDVSALGQAVSVAPLANQILVEGTGGD
jgi:hypothetical protein